MNKDTKKLFDTEIEAVVRRYLEKHGWNLTHAANELGLSHPTMRKLAKRGGFWPRTPQTA